MRGFKKTNMILHGLEFGHAPYRVYKRESHYFINSESHMVRIALKDYKPNLFKTKR